MLHYNITIPACRVRTKLNSWSSSLERSIAVLPVEENHCTRRENEHDESEGDEEDKRRRRQRLIGKVHAKRDDDEGETEENGCDCDTPLSDVYTPRVQC